MLMEVGGVKKVIWEKRCEETQLLYSSSYSDN